MGEEARRQEDDISKRGEARGKHSQNEGKYSIRDGAGNTQAEAIAGMKGIHRRAGLWAETGECTAGSIRLSDGTKTRSRQWERGIG